MRKADDRRSLIAAQVPSFNGDKIEIKPTRHSACILRHDHLLPVETRNSCLAQTRRQSPPYESVLTEEFDLSSLNGQIKTYI